MIAVENTMMNIGGATIVILILLIILVVLAPALFWLAFVVFLLFIFTASEYEEYYSKPIFYGASTYVVTVTTSKDEDSEEGISHIKTH